jgi:hypothetical protein
MLSEERECLIFKRRCTFIKSLTLQRDSRNIIKVKEGKKIYPPTSVIIAIRWDTLLRIVLPKGNNTRGEITKDIMPMHLKMMSHPRS